MTPVEVSLILGLLSVIATYAPGVIATLMGKPDDAAALAHCRATLEAIPRDPAKAGIDRVR